MGVVVREEAFKSLKHIEREGAYSNLEIRRVLSRVFMSEKDAHLYTALVYGVLQNALYLDNRIALFVKQNQKIDADVRIILRMAVYQMLFMNRVPDYAIISEAVALTKKYDKRAKGFVNGVLRNMQRSRNKLKAWDDAAFDNEKAALSVRYSVPLPIVYQYYETYGKKMAPVVLSHVNDTPPLSVRVNTLVMTREALMQAFEKMGIVCAAGKMSPVAIHLSKTSVAELVGTSLYQQGAFTIQDQGAMCISERLAPQPGETVLDLCAAPGGKTTHLAQLMQNRGKIIACDLHESRVKLIEKTAERMGITIIKVKTRDGTADWPEAEGQFDRVLLDAPCSGTGIIRRKPEIRYRLDKDMRRAIRKTQKKLLTQAASCLKPGGTLVYSTCSVDPLEDSGQVREFCKTHPDMQMDTNSERVTGLPGDGCDGFYMVKLIKKK